MYTILYTHSSALLYCTCNTHIHIDMSSSIDATYCITHFQLSFPTLCNMQRCFIFSFISESNTYSQYFHVWTFVIWHTQNAKQHVYQYQLNRHSYIYMQPQLQSASASSNSIHSNDVTLFIRQYQQQSALEFRLMTAHVESESKHHDDHRKQASYMKRQCYDYKARKIKMHNK